MSFEYFNPWVLLGLVAAGVCVVAALRSYAGLGRVQWTLHVTLRVLAVLALLAAVSGVTFDRTTHTRGTTAVIVQGETSEAVASASSAIEGSAAGGDTVHVLQSGRNLHDALASACRWIPADADGRVVLIGGEEKIDDALVAVARKLKSQGIIVDAVTVPAPAERKRRVVALTPVSDPRAGVDFNVAVTMEPRTLPMTLRQKFDTPGAHLVREDLGGMGDRFLPVWVSPPVRAAVVAGEGTRVEHLRKALVARGVRPELLSDQQVAASGFDWDAFDAVVLVNVPMPALGEDAMQSLSRYVFSGGGLVMLGGSRSFGCGGYYQTALERALPVYMDPLRDPPSYALVVVLDKSWSMGDAVSKSIHKVDLVREVAIAATTPMTPNDSFGLISFDSQPHVILELRKIGDRELITKTISTLGAFGTTNFYRAMSNAFELLKETKATYKHIVLLSDGRSSVPNLNYQTLVNDMAKKRVTVSTVGVGDDCHRQLLADIATWGKGKHYHIATADGIPQILLDESNRLKEILTVEIPSTVKVATDDPIIAGLDVSAAPKLLGFNRVRAKESADVLMTVGAKDEPLLAVWHYGTGRAAAFASDAGEHWCADWLDTWPEGLARIVQETVVSVARPTPADTGIDMTPGEDGITISYDATDAWGLPMTGLTLALEVVTWQGEAPRSESAAMPEGAPGVYRTEGSRLPQPPYLLRLRDDADRTLAVRSAALLDGQALSDAERTARAERLAEAGGGRVNPSPEQVFERKMTDVRRRASVQPMMLLAALCFFLFDVIVRRYKAVTRFFARS